MCERPTHPEVATRKTPRRTIMTIPFPLLRTASVLVTEPVRTRARCAAVARALTVLAAVRTSVKIAAADFGRALRLVVDGAIAFRTVRPGAAWRADSHESDDYSPHHFP